MILCDYYALPCSRNLFNPFFSNVPTMVKNLKTTLKEFVLVNVNMPTAKQNFWLMKHTLICTFQEERNLFLLQTCSKQKPQDQFKNLDLSENIIGLNGSSGGEGFLLVLMQKILVLGGNTRFTCLCTKLKEEKLSEKLQSIQDFVLQYIVPRDFLAIFNLYCGGLKIVRIFLCFVCCKQRIFINLLTFQNF